MITHYDLFAGIGGFSLALEEVFPDVPVRHVFCEWESFPTAVLRQHWPDGEFYGDIADLVSITNAQRSRRQGGLRQTKGRDRLRSRNGSDQTQNWSIVTGGFPCQPFSHAGQRKGTADDRYQWPNMFEVIRNVKPEWVIAENVRGLVTWNDGMVLETVCTDLESEGYEVQPFIIPAVAVGAPHRRDRVWIIGHRANADRQRISHGPREVQKANGEIPERHDDAKPSNTSRRYPDWERNWQEVAVATCDDSMDDGLSRHVDGVSYSKGRWRKESLKAYGNGIVPEVAMNIMQAIRVSQYEQNVI